MCRLTLEVQSAEMPSDVWCGGRAFGIIVISGIKHSVQKCHMNDSFACSHVRMFPEKEVNGFSFSSSTFPNIIIINVIIIIIIFSSSSMTS